MTDDKSIHDFNREIDCTYEEEKYSVRDNGAVLKHPRIGMRPRRTDNQWTFGKPNVKKGYMEIVTVRVHRIVATAFHGEPSTKEHVVDHIDTNKRNNRPENLRWVTRLENVLLNPITVRRIELSCGCSIEEFLADPSKFRDKFQEPNYEWMCTVSKQEAQSSLKRILNWVKSDKVPSGSTLGEWIYKQPTYYQHVQQVEIIPIPEIIESKTANAVQLKWRVPSEFPCCPQEFGEEPIKAYAKNLKTGSIFCQNNSYTSLVSKSAISDDHQTLYVMTESKEKEKAVKPWALAKITYENGLFVHSNLGNFFNQDGAEKQFCLAQGFEWTGGATFDELIM